MVINRHSEKWVCLSNYLSICVSTCSFFTLNSTLIYNSFGFQTIYLFHFAQFFAQDFLERFASFIPSIHIPTSFSPLYFSFYQSITFTIYCLKNLPICLSKIIPISLSLSLYIYMSKDIYLSIYLSNSLRVCQSISIYLSVCTVFTH